MDNVQQLAENLSVLLRILSLINSMVNKEHYIPLDLFLSLLQKYYMIGKVEVNTGLVKRIQFF